MNRRNLIVGSVAGVVGSLVPFTVESVRASDSVDNDPRVGGETEEGVSTLLTIPEPKYTEDGSYCKVVEVISVRGYKDFLLTVYPQIKTYLGNSNFDDYPYGLIYKGVSYDLKSVDKNALVNDLNRFVAAYEETAKHYDLPLSMWHAEYSEKKTKKFQREMMNHFFGHRFYE